MKTGNWASIFCCIDVIDDELSTMSRMSTLLDWAVLAPVTCSLAGSSEFPEVQAPPAANTRPIMSVIGRRHVRATWWGTDMRTSLDNRWARRRSNHAISTPSPRGAQIPFRFLSRPRPDAKLAPDAVIRTAVAGSAAPVGPDRDPGGPRRARGRAARAGRAGG